MVIGSGAGGAPVAAALAEAGLGVVVLEAGSHLETRDFTGDEAEMTRRLWRTAAARPGRSLYAGACVGGSTAVNDALCFRPPADLLAAWRQEHDLGGLTDEALAPFVDRVWEEIGASSTGPAHTSRNAERLAAGAARLGWCGASTPRSVRGCANLGLCNLGCPIGAKQSALLTWVPRAERAGARVLAHTRAERIGLDGGRVRGVDAVTVGPDGRASGERVLLDAPVVCVAAGVLNTAPLLLRSAVAGVTGAEHAARRAQLPFLAEALVLVQDRTRGRAAADGTIRYAHEPDDVERLRAGMRQAARAYLAAGALEV